MNANVGGDSGEHPGQALRRLLDERGWTVTELAEITGYARSNLSSVLTGRSGVSPDLAVALGAAFGNEAAEWLRWNSDYQLSLVEVDADRVERRARLFLAAPVREMQKRGWLSGTTNDVAELEPEIERFFGGPDNAGFKVATLRRTTEPVLSSADRAWCHRARQMAEAMSFVAVFDHKRLPAAEKKLRSLAAYVNEVGRVAETMAYFGIRFVVIEPLPGGRIDGAAFWIGESPVIAVSLRLDRIDAFWFTVFHEFMHIKNGDSYSVDVALVEEGDRGFDVAVADDEAERRANAQAASALVPRNELDAFIARTAPRYAAMRIIQFAHLIKMHPGVIVGQLQHRGELTYSSHRPLLVRVRSLVAETAMTDGWGHTPPAVLR